MMEFDTGSVDINNLTTKGHLHQFSDIEYDTGSMQVAKHKPRTPKPIIKAKRLELDEKRACDYICYAMRKEPRIISMVADGYNGIFKACERVILKNRNESVDLVKAYKNSGSERSLIAKMIDMLSSGVIDLPNRNKYLTNRVNAKHQIRIVSAKEIDTPNYKSISKRAGLLNGKPVILAFRIDAINSLKGHIKLSTSSSEKDSLYSELCKAYKPQYRGGIKSMNEVTPKAKPVCRITAMSNAEIASKLYDRTLTFAEVKASNLSKDRKHKVQSIFNVIKSNN